MDVFFIDPFLILDQVSVELVVVETAIVLQVIGITLDIDIVYQIWKFAFFFCVRLCILIVFLG